MPNAPDGKASLLGGVYIVSLEHAWRIIRLALWRVKVARICLCALHRPRAGQFHFGLPMLDYGLPRRAFQCALTTMLMRIIQFQLVLQAA
jgi:hypothetical protein